MKFQDRIISELAKRECTKIARRVIRRLQKITNALLSGEDTELKNAWDEICVQVQSQESFYWDVYVDEMMRLVLIELDSQPNFVKEAIWLQTDNGQDWMIDNDCKESKLLTKDECKLEGNNNNDDDEIPVYEDDIADYFVRQYILVAAGQWHNRRIEAYIDRVCSA